MSEERCWFAPVAERPDGAWACAEARTAGGAVAGWLAVWKRSAKPVRDAMPADPRAFDPDGEKDAEWVVAELVPIEFSAWKTLKCSGAVRDPRLLCDVRVDGVHMLLFVDALCRSRRATLVDLPGWPHQGERAVPDLL